MKKETTSLYAIEEKIYTHEKIEKLGLVDEIEYAFVDVVLEHLGNDIYIISDNDYENFEVIKYLGDEVYDSLVILPRKKLEDVLSQ